MNIHKISLLLIVGFLFVSYASAEQHRIYSVTLNYDDGELSKQSLFVTTGNFNELQDANDRSYTLNIISFSDKVLYTAYFEIDLFFYGLAPEGTFDEDGVQISIPQQEVFTLRQTDIQLILPYFPNAKRFDIYNPDDEKVLEISAAYLSDVCGDNICQLHESFESCPIDCPSGINDDYCDGLQDSICDPDCSAATDFDCKTAVPSSVQVVIPPPQLSAILVLIGILAILITAVILFTRIRSKGENKS